MDEVRGRSLTTLGLLAEPVRRRLYEYVATQPGAVDRQSAADGVGIARPLAAFHLDRLVRGGLLTAEYRRRSGRSGPGAGRPAKFYRRNDATVEVSLPARRYVLAAEIFAEGLEEAGEAATDGALNVARDHGRRVAGSARTQGRLSRRSGRTALRSVLTDVGYEPEDAADGGFLLRNCPFHALVPEHRPLTCAMNLALLRGVSSAIPEAGLTPQRRDEPGLCCVAFAAS